MITNIHKNGYCLPKANLIVINNKLSETEKLKVLLHEAAHFNQIEYLEWYQKTSNLHSKMEFEAETTAILEILENYMSENELNPQDVNYINFIENFGFDIKYADFIENTLKEKFKKYLKDNNKILIVGSAK